MVLNTWWKNDLQQRYWMEVATDDFGDALQAPKGQGVWSYDLVGEVKPGDRVLHWQGATGAVRALVGWSEVVKPPRTVPRYTWRPRGTAGRALTVPRTTPGWFVELGGLNAFERPITAALLQGRRKQVMDINKGLEAKHGKPTYFPFYLYGNGTELRAQQAYFLKFPVELFRVIPRLGDGLVPPESGGEEIDETVERAGAKAGAGRIARAQDPELRAAIERRSVDVAIEHYVDLGARREDIKELGKPYDLVVRLHGSERHVEVKGSSMVIDTVELTANEVDHARQCRVSDLVVVDGIACARDSVGHVTVNGGSLRYWPDWTPADEALRVTKLGYRLPTGAQ